MLYKVNRLYHFTGKRRELCSVDATLARIETELGSFQRDLRSISREIQHLQTESVHMNIKLKNRQVLLFIKLANRFFIYRLTLSD